MASEHAITDADLTQCRRGVYPRTHTSRPARRTTARPVNRQRLRSPSRGGLLRVSVLPPSNGSRPPGGAGGGGGGGGVCGSLGITSSLRSRPRTRLLPPLVL